MVKLKPLENAQTASCKQPTLGETSFLFYTYIRINDFL